MKNNLLKFFILLLPIVLSISSCSDLRRAVGKEKVIPDEFSVAVTPSLLVPPGYKIDPDKIKSNIVDEETTGVALSKRSGLDILFGYVPSTGVIIDTKKESLRVRKKSNEEATPAFDKNTGKIILIK